MTTIQIKRVAWGKENTSEAMKEYHIVGIHSTICGTKSEILEWCHDKGLDKVILEVV